VDMKFFIVLSLMLSANVGFSKSAVAGEKAKSASRAPASEDGAAPLLVIPMDREMYKALHKDQFVPDCEGSEVLLSNGTCGASPYSNISANDDWDKWVDTRKSQYCYHVKEVTSRSYDSNLAVAQVQKIFNRWEDNLYANSQESENGHLGAPHFRSCEDCGVCGEKSDNGNQVSVSFSRNVIKSFESDRNRPANIPKPPKAPGFTIIFRH